MGADAIVPRVATGGARDVFAGPGAISIARTTSGSLPEVVAILLLASESQSSSSCPVEDEFLAQVASLALPRRPVGSVMIRQAVADLGTSVSRLLSTLMPRGWSP